MIEQMKASLQEREKFWTAFSESIENGLSLDMKFRIAKELASLTTHSFASSLCSVEVAMSLSLNPFKTCLLFHELLGLLKPFFSVLFNALSEKQEIVISLSE